MSHTLPFVLSLTLTNLTFAARAPHVTQPRSISEATASYEPALAATSALVPARVETWRGGAVAAQSLTFDDNLSCQVQVLIPMLEARHLRGTFFLVTIWLDYMIGGTGWADWAIVQGMGHELASHTVSHPYAPDPLNIPQGLTGVSPAALVYELAHSKDELRSRLGVAEGLTLAYPYTLHNSAVRAESAHHYLAARAVSSDTVEASPADLFAIGAFGWQQGNTWHDMASRATDRALARGAWAVDMIHGCDGQGWSPPSSTDYRLYFDYIESKVAAGLLWVAPFGEVVRYIKERDAATVAVVADGDGVHVVRLKLSQPLPPGPTSLTVSFPLPSGWGGVQAFDEAGAPVACDVVLRGGVPHALVDVLPEAPGQVALVKVVEG